MDQVPPPPPPSTPTPSGGGAAARPGVITAVAVLMFVAGFSILVVAITGGSAFVGYGGGVLVLFGILFLAIGGAMIWAGVGILKLQKQAWTVGLVLTGISALLNLLQIGGATGSAIVGLAIDGFIIWALWTNQELFA